MSVVLKSANEKNTLYKNPKILIILPQGIESIKVNSINKLYADEFEVSKAELKNIDGLGKVIAIELKGEQTKYINEISQGIQIIINASITFAKNTAANKTDLTLRYTNDNGNEKYYETKTSLDLISKNGVLVYSKVNNYNNEGTVLESTTNENLNGKLDINTKQKNIKIERSIVNNTEDTISGISIVGKIPTTEENVNGENLKSTFVSKLKNINVEGKNAKIYYSEQENTEVNQANWTENIENLKNIKSYKIELENESLNPKETAVVSYELNVPENLGYNESAYETVNIKYNDKNNTVSKDYATFLATNLNSEEGSSLKQNIVTDFGEISVNAVSGRKTLVDGESINEGQAVKEIVTLTNNTGSDINNLKVTAKQENAIFYNNVVTIQQNTLTGYDMESTRIIEDEKIDKKEFTKETLKKGESVSFEYQFSAKEAVNENITGTLVLEAENMNAQTYTTLSNPIKQANLKVTMECSYNEEREIPAGGYLPYILTVKNLSDKVLENVEVKVPIAEFTNFKESDLIGSSEYSYEGIENNEIKFKILSINPQQTIEILEGLSVDNFEESEHEISLDAVAKVDNGTYYSNVIKKKAYNNKLNLTVDLKGNIESEEVQTGDIITYTATIKNESDEEVNITITDDLPKTLEIKQIYMIKDGKRKIISNPEENYIYYETTVKSNEEIQFVIDTMVDESKAEGNNEIKNNIEITGYNLNLKSNEVTYKMKNVENPEPDNPDNPKPDNPKPDNPKPENPDNPQPNPNPDTENPNDNQEQEKSSSISGQVWLDENENGQKDTFEYGIKGMEVSLIEAESGNIATDKNENEISKITTDETGEYTFNNLKDGKYVVIIAYDTQKYSITDYKKTGVDETINSDVIAKELSGYTIATTETIEVSENEVQNIDAGFIENKIFDLKLDKYITKVIVQNSKQTKTMQYDKTQLAKVELDSKQINNSTILVEYSINITNEGELAGYANDIVDYIPNGYKINTEINKDWYTTNNGNTLHNTSLENEIINPGETKTLTLTLIKNMNENSTGTAINTAEIAKASNKQSIADKDSVPGNKATGEDDISSAELIVSIRTGAGIIIGIIILTIAVLLLIIFGIKKINVRRGKNEKNNIKT